jgi:hypothetical protein
MPFLKEHIYSNFSNRLYGAAGSQVTIIANHSNVQIVEDSLGNRYSVKTELIGDTALTVVPELKAIETTIAGRSQKKKSAVAQSNLF